MTDMNNKYKYEYASSRSEVMGEDSLEENLHDKVETRASTSRRKQPLQIKKELERELKRKEGKIRAQKSHESAQRREGLDSARASSGSEIRSRSSGTRARRSRQHSEEEVSILESVEDVQHVEMADSQARTDRRNREKDEPIPGTSGTKRITKRELDITRKVMAETRETVVNLIGEEDCPITGVIRAEGGQGCPAKDGRSYLKQLKQGQAKLVKLAQDIRVLRDALIPAGTSAGRKKEEETALRELRYTPAERLPEAILEAVNLVDKVLEKSSSLKSEHRGNLNRSAAITKAALTLLVQRYENPETGYEKDAEMERMRNMISSQKKELKELHEIKAQYLRSQREM